MFKNRLLSIFFYYFSKKYDILIMIGDNMKKNGFTLIEVLAVVVILGIIVTLFVPNTVKLIRQNNLKVYKIKEKELLKAAEDYANYDKAFEGPTESSPTKYITMTKLVENAYMNKILDSNSGNECKAFVKVTNSDIHDYNYEACLICDEYKTDKDFCTLSAYQNL